MPNVDFPGMDLSPMATPPSVGRSLKAELECGTRVVSKLERLDKLLENIAEQDKEFHDLLAELDSKLGPVPPSATAPVCGGVAGTAPKPCNSLETSINKLQSLEGRISRNVMRLRHLIASL